MNVQLIERGTKWFDANLRSQEKKTEDTVRHQSKCFVGQGWRKMKNELESILIYYVAMFSIFPLSYGFHDSALNYQAGSVSLAIYFLSCALITLFCLSYVAIKLLLDSKNATRITKALSVIYFLLIINNVFMAVDAIEHMEQWTALDTLDTLINGSSDWLIPVGLADLVLIVIGVLCLRKRYG